MFKCDGQECPSYSDREVMLETCPTFETNNFVKTHLSLCRDFWHNPEWKQPRRLGDQPTYRSYQSCCRSCALPDRSRAKEFWLVDRRCHDKTTWGPNRIVHRQGGLVDMGEELVAVLIGGRKESCPRHQVSLFQVRFSRIGSARIDRNSQTVLKRDSNQRDGCRVSTFKRCG